MATKTEEQKLIDAINKKYGPNTIFIPAEKPELVEMGVFSSGSILLDIALGGGFPYGRSIELFGKEQSGKTTQCYYAIAEVQKRGQKAVFIDAEYAFNEALARRCGVDTSKLLVVHPESGEHVFDIIEALARSKEYALIVVDSVSALVPAAEEEASMEQQSIGLQARLMSKGLRKITGIIAKNKCTVIFINQIRTDVAVKYGNNEVTSGGRALRFYSSVRIVMRQGQPIKDGKLKVGHEVHFRVVKNKIAAPELSGSYNLYYGSGIDKIAELFEVAIKFNIVERRGAYYSYKDYKTQGADPFIKLLKENDDLFNEIKDLVYENIKNIEYKNVDMDEDALEEELIGENEEF